MMSVETTERSDTVPIRLHDAPDGEVQDSTADEPADESAEMPLPCDARVDEADEQVQREQREPARDHLMRRSDEKARLDALLQHQEALSSEQTEDRTRCADASDERVAGDG